MALTQIQQLQQQVAAYIAANDARSTAIETAADLDRTDLASFKDGLAAFQDTVNTTLQAILALVQKAPASGTGGGTVELGQPIAGATIDGSPAATDTLKNLSNGTVAALTLPAGNFSTTAPIDKAITITGHGSDTILDCGAVGPFNGHAVIVQRIDGVKLRDMLLRGAHNSDADAAGVRTSDIGIGFDFDGLEITGNDIGFLGQAANHTIRNCYVHHNGANHNPPGHDGYCTGRPETVMTFEYNTFGPSLTGHELQFRGGMLNATKNDMTTCGNGAVYNLPNGANFDIAGDTWHLPANAADLVIFSNGAITAGGSGTLTGVHIDNPTGKAPIIHGNGGTLNLVDCTYTGVAPVLKGWGTVTGAFAAG